MKTGLIVLGVIILIVIGGIGWAIGINNQLVGQEQRGSEAAEHDSPARRAA